MESSERTVGQAMAEKEARRAFNRKALLAQLDSFVNLDAKGGQVFGMCSDYRPSKDPEEAGTNCITRKREAKGKRTHVTVCTNCAAYMALADLAELVRKFPPAT